MILLKDFFIIIISFLISNKLIKLFILKFKEKFIDIPNFRSMHVIPTPRGGGIIFAFITIGASLIYLFINGYSNIYIIPILCIPLVVVGILDDLFKDIFFIFSPHQASFMQVIYLQKLSRKMNSLIT